MHIYIYIYIHISTVLSDNLPSVRAPCRVLGRFHVASETEFRLWARGLRGLRRWGASVLDFFGP